MYETSRILIDAWGTFVSTHNWLWDFIPKPWVAVDDSLREGPAMNWLWITLLCLAIICVLGTTTEEIGKHGKPLLQKLARIATYTVVNPPVFLAGMIASLQIITGFYLYGLWIVVAIFVGAFAFFAYPTEFLARLVS